MFWPLVIVLLLVSLVAVFAEVTEEDVTSSPLLKDFDWKAYCQLYPDLPLNGIDTDRKVRRHYLEFGVQEGRQFPKVVPDEPHFSLTQKKLANYIQFMDDLKLPMQDRTFIVFHVGKIDARNSIEVILNNLRIFHSAMALDHSGTHGLFYLFNIVDGADNMLFHHINTSNFNSALNSWSASPSDIYTHLRTLSLFSTTLMHSFGSVFFLNNGVRGPLLNRAEGQWIKPFHELLFANNVGIVGATMSCEVAPHIQTHFFGLRTAIVPTVTAEYDQFRTFKSWPELIRFYEVGLTEHIQRSGYNISSLFYYRRVGLPYFNGQCLTAVKFVNDHTIDNPSRWCDITNEEVVLYKWGGDMLRTNGFICDQTKLRMKNTMLALSAEMPGHLQLDVPETLRGGSFFDLFKQYEQEMFREVLVANPVDPASTNASRRTKFASDKVCLLVRTASLHDVQRNVSLMSRDVLDGMDNFIKSLLRQTDNRWEAYFLITDQKPFSSRLKEILASYSDSRLIFMHINRKYRKPYTIEDAGYTATDVAMRKLLNRHDCAWISATNADNIYGTEIIERVRAAGHTPMRNARGERTAPPDMVLVPIDSRNFMYQDFYNRQLTKLWDQMCVGLQSMVEMTLLGYTTQPRPVVGRVDLAGVFFSRPKLHAENLFFGNFTHAHKYPCKGCQDGYFTEYLTTHRGWKYRQLPIDGMKSILFHGPSPLWCLAAGHVWFSHPEVNKVKCYSQRTVDAIRVVDRMETKVFDWMHFDHTDRMCLRLSEFGFDRKDRLG